MAGYGDDDGNRILDGVRQRAMDLDGVGEFRVG
jgi:hypothetical protein